MRMMNNRTIVVFAPNGEEIGEIDAEDFEKSSRDRPFIWVAHGEKTGGIRVQADEVYPLGHENYGEDLFLPEKYRAVMAEGTGGFPERRADLVPRRARTAAEASPAAPTTAPVAGPTDARLADRVETLKAALASERDQRRTLANRVARLEALINSPKKD
jgi:hypothetical protein